jgi:hypothetical protein
MNTAFTSAVAPAAPKSRRWFKVYADLVFGGYLAALNPASVKVYLAILAHADATGRAFPSTQRLAGVCNLSRRCVSQAVEQLQEAGLLDCCHVNGVPNQYEMHHPRGHCPRLPAQIVPTPCADTSHPPAHKTTDDLRTKQQSTPVEKCAVSRSIDQENKNKSNESSSCVETEEQEVEAASAPLSRCPSDGDVASTRRSVRERAAADADAQATVALLDAQPPARLEELRRQVLAEAGDFMGSLLQGKTHHTSPILAALLRGKL